MEGRIEYRYTMYDDQIHVGIFFRGDGKHKLQALPLMLFSVYSFFVSVMHFFPPTSLVPSLIL